MSGIAAIIRFDGVDIESGKVEQMTASMAHRGPDGIRHWVQGGAALGQCMFCTTPESLEEIQPLTNEDETLVLIMDGRVDNWEELRTELLANGANLRTRTDAELLLRAYELWGPECLDHIDGDFALFIWDASRREAFCARDRMGNKPFFYHWDGQILVVASEIKAILVLPGFKKVVNEGILAEYLAMEWYTRDETLWLGITRLVAAHRMRVSECGVQIHHYWEPDYWAELPYTDELELAEHYRKLLKEQVRRMSRSHKAIACEVSGGLDSSAIIALAEDLRRHDQLPAPAIAGYGLAFPDDPAANEIEYMRAVAQYLQCSVREVAPTLPPYSWYKKNAEETCAFPGYPNGSMALGLRQGAVQAGSRVILSGMGGDEWLGMLSNGAYYREEVGLKNWRNVYNCVINDRDTLGLKCSLWWLLRFGFAPLLPEEIKQVRRKLFLAPEREKAYWLSPKFRSIIADRRKEHQSLEVPRLARYGQNLQYQILSEPYSALAREMEELMCAQLGLDLRSPFHARSIIELAFATPERFRSRGKTTKWLHRLAMEGILPELVIKRKTKADFMGHFSSQLSQLDVDFIREIVSRRSAWLSAEHVIEMYEGLQGAPTDGYLRWVLWTVIGCDALDGPT